MEFLESWEKWVFLGGIAVFFVLWRRELQSFASMQEERQGRILRALDGLMKRIGDLQTTSTEEHRSMSHLVSTTTQQAVDQHHGIVVALAQLSQAWQDFIADERVRRRG